MKIKKDCIHDAFKMMHTDGHWYSKPLGAQLEITFKAMDEYAEEYAKAMIEWLRKTQFAGELTIETADKFKESLKK